MMTSKKAPLLVDHENSVGLLQFTDLNGIAYLKIDCDDQGRIQKFKEATGTVSLDLGSELIEQVAKTLSNQDGRSNAERMNLALQAILEMRPRDRTEALLVSQMIGTHNLVMKLMARNIVGDLSIEELNAQGNRLSKLSRLFLDQIEALERYRGKEQQKVTVQHVYVEEGGQAVVGNVTHKTPKGGG